MWIELESRPQGCELLQQTSAGKYYFVIQMLPVWISDVRYSSGNVFPQPSQVLS